MKKDLTVVALSLLVLSGAFVFGAFVGREDGRREIQEQAAKRHLAQFYLNNQTGKIEFQYLDLQAYTQSIFEAIVPQRVPAPPQ